MALWRACGLVRPWNDPRQDIQRKPGEQRELFLVGCLGELLARGCPKVTLMVRSSNESVIAFYRQLGYAEDAVVVLGKRLIPDL